MATTMRRMAQLELSTGAAGQDSCSLRERASVEEALSSLKVEANADEAVAMMSKSSSRVLTFADKSTRRKISLYRLRSRLCDKQSLPVPKKYILWFLYRDICRLVLVPLSSTLNIVMETLKFPPFTQESPF